MRSRKRSISNASRLRRVVQASSMLCLALVVLLQQSSLTIAICHHSSIPSLFLVTASSRDDVQETRIDCPYCSARANASKQSCCCKQAASCESEILVVGTCDTEAGSRPCCSILAKSPVDAWAASSSVVQENDATFVLLELLTVLAFDRIVSPHDSMPDASPRVFDRVVTFSHFLI